MPLYGGRRARLLHHFYLLAARLGMLRSWHAIEWRRVRRLVMVCKGNICRSPYAEARARLLHMSAISCGLQCGAGAPANDRALVNARRRKVELHRHRTTPIDASPIGPGDLLLAMEPSQARMLAPVAARAGAQVTLLGLWSAPPRPYLHDPYGLRDEDFQSCYATIDSALVRLHHLVPRRARVAGNGPEGYD